MSGFNPVEYVKGAYRNSPWVVISVAIHAILFAGLSLWVISKTIMTKDEPPAKVALAKPVEKVEAVIQPPEIIDRKAMPKNEEAEVVSYEEDVYMPTTQATEEEDLHLDRGDPTALDNLPAGATGGTSIGVGAAGGHYGTGKASPFAGRRAGGGGKGRNIGKVEGTEKSVLEGLRWLIRHQNADGSWSAATLLSHCAAATPCVGADQKFTANYDEGLTGLALLAFLGAGYGHDAKETIVDTAMGKRYKLGEVITNGLKWLVERQKEDGSFSASRPFMYNEALATLAVTEAYGLSGAKYWKKPAEKGVLFLLGAQKPNPSGTGMWGWRYASRQDIEGRHTAGTLDDTHYAEEMRDADVSATGWCVMALKSAELSGIEVPREALEGAVDYIKSMTAENGLVGYYDRALAGQPVKGVNDVFTYHASVMSALGMCTRTFVTHDIEDPFLEQGAKQIIKDLPTVSKDKLSIDYYYWYYATIALNQFDGPESPKKTNKYWGPWNEAMKDAIISLQDATDKRDVCSRGGWLVGDRWCHYGGPIYATAINTLTLEVYYRYPNAFGAGKRGGAVATEKPK